MKKEIPTPILAAVGAVAVALILFFGFKWFNNSVNPAEDAELAKKQWEVEAARTPKGDPAPAPAVVPTDPNQPGTSFSPGRESEMNARGGR